MNRIVSNKGNRRRGEGWWRRIGQHPTLQRARKTGSYLLLVSALAAGLPLLGYAGYQQVMRSDYFEAKQVRVEGAQRLSREEVLHAAGLDQPEALNLMRAEASEIAERLRRHPWVADAEVRIDLPDTLHITLRERRLLGLVQDDRVYLVDTDGHVIKPLSNEDAVDSPVVSGFQGQLSDRAPHTQAALLTAFALIEQYEAMGLQRWAELAAVHFDQHLGYTLFTAGAPGVEVRLGADRLPARLQRLVQLTTLLESREMRAEYILLDQPDDLDHVVVKPVPRVVAPQAVPVAAPVPPRRR
jgi:cell division septal protein FtsQ